MTAEIDTTPDEMRAAVAALARRARNAEGPLLRALNALGGNAESWMSGLPAPARQAIDHAARSLLSRLYSGAAQSRDLLPDAGPWAYRLAAAAGGAAGGATGLTSALVELPASIMVMFAAMQRAAAKAGFDPNAQQIKLICIDIFGTGAPGTGDDGVNSAFLGARIAMNSATVQTVIGRILPAFSAMLGKSLAAKAVPIIGAAAGAGINFTFTRYFEEVAHVRFGLMRLVADHGEEPVHRAFRAEMAKVIPSSTVSRG